MRCRYAWEVKMVFHVPSVGAGASHFFFSFSFFLSAYPFAPETDPTFGMHSSITDVFLSPLSLQGPRAAAIWAFHNGGSENAEGGSVRRHAGWLSEGGSPHGRVWQPEYCQAFRYLNEVPMSRVPPTANLLWGCWACRGKHAWLSLNANGNIGLFCKRKCLLQKRWAFLCATACFAKLSTRISLKT